MTIPAGPTSSVLADARAVSMVRAIGWVGIGRWTTQVLTWAATFLVARLLTPVDYGIVGMAAVVYGAISLVSEFGLTAAVVTSPDMSPARARQLNTISILVGVGGLLVMALMASPTARFFNEPRLVAVLLVLSLTFLVSSVKAVPDGLLQRAHRFRALAGVEIGRAVAQTATTLILAVYGAGYWSLVAGMLAGPAGSAVANVWLIWPGTGRIDGATAASTMRFSLDLVGGRLAWFWYTNADFVIAGRLLGTATLGAYSLAWTIANIPIDKMGTLVGRVALSFFSAAQADRASLRRDLLRLSEGLALVTTPACIGLALVAPDLVHVVLGPRWTAAVVPLQLLCAYAPIRALLLLFPPALMALGRQRFLLWNNVWAGVLMPAGFLAASQWGAAGIAAAWVVLYPLVAWPQFRALTRAIDLQPLEYLSALRPAFVATGVMSVTVLGLTAAMPSNPSFEVLAGKVTAGAIAYVLTLALLFPARMAAVVRVIRSVRGTQPPVPAEA